ncbi:hypothetical protein [Colwellia sp. KU-HH00111]|uniref:hypothetical protein n=1 Tax=Colwellia sp. KU-HH00111 TaxID=3127652 RepID=UPI003365334F
MKWLNLPWLKSFSLFLLLCTPKNAAKVLFNVRLNEGELSVILFVIMDVYTI